MMFKRLMTLIVLLGIVCFIVIGVRLFNLQVTNYQFYQDKAVEQQTRDKIVMPQRGTIYDSNLKPLAMSATAEMVTLEPVKIDDAEQGELIARTLSEILDLDYDTVLKKAQKKSSYEIIKRGVEKDTTDKIREFIKENKLDSIYMVEDSKRYYPYGNFASRIIGFVGTDNQGLDGIEAVYDSKLSGTPGRIITAKNAKGDDMSSGYEKYYDAQNGDGIVLTIDEVVQHFLEKNLEIAHQDNRLAKQATGIIMNVKTGEILAMSSKPDYDPNDPWTISDEGIMAEIDGLSGDERSEAIKEARTEQWRNMAVQDAYEPGSTFKIITSAMALEEGSFSNDSTFYCGGSIMVEGWPKPIGCWKAGGHGTQTFAQAVQNSCNPAFVRIGQAVGNSKFKEYFTAFGLMEKTGIDLPGEATGIFFSDSSFNLVELSVAAFGQTFKITPIQLITAVAAAANGGNLIKPHLVKQIIDADGNVKETVEPTVIRQVISKENSKQLCKILESVVKDGTGKNAYVSGYRVGGKTGTSVKTDIQNQTGQTDLRIASFCGIAPADDPEIAVLVLLDEPQVIQKTGGITAAPVVGRIMADVLPYLGVEAQYTADELALKDINIPLLTGMTLSDAEKTLSGKSINYEIVGDGSTVTDQVPAAGATVPSTAKVILYMDGEKPNNPIELPDLIRLTPTQVKNQLDKLGLYIKTTGATGNGNIVVTKQTPSAGQTVYAGDVITIEFTDLDQLAT